ncbi:hypothetical protein LUZ61_013947 [Rhynchospora tenuis]|uniref:MRN complex-interacting protein N-terminal domain-containing protein n=1 Tax=Rhynchospora tenuis TaxID=198213 RepID=A0AAD5WD78_9POAL|nr:hypothetical protein LUZ61_013947 [Rhynchospora tenuis]
MPTVFVALQCAQCSTMQVKQQKKSGNKWVCAVCNLRQSVCRVYARGPMARDLRKFVQEFNMSRMAIDQSVKCDSTDLPLSASNLPIEACQSKKRMDWSEYLDPLEETKDGQNKENELDVEIVTEMPQKKAKVTSRYQQKIYENKLFHNNAPKRKRDQEGYNSQYNSCSNGGKEASTCKLSNQRSRWSDYLDNANEEEEIGNETVGRGSNSVIPSDATQKLATEELVEDEVHPDFT